MAAIMNKIERIKQLVDFGSRVNTSRWSSVASAVFMAEHKRCFNLSTMRTGRLVRLCWRMICSGVRTVHAAC